MNKYSDAAISGYDWRLGREHGGWWEWTGGQTWRVRRRKASAELGGDSTTGTFPLVRTPWAHLGDLQVFFTINICFQDRVTEPAGLRQVSVRLLQAQVPYFPTTGATSLSDARQC